MSKEQEGPTISDGRQVPKTTVICRRGGATVFIHANDTHLEPCRCGDPAGAPQQDSSVSAPGHAQGLGRYAPPSKWWTTSPVVPSALPPVSLARGSAWLMS